MTEQNHSAEDGLDDLKLPSNRSFGFVMSAAFAIFALYPIFLIGTPNWWLLGIGAVFLLLTIVKPDSLAILNRIWTRLGLLMAKFANPVVLGLMYFLIVSPIAIGMKLAGRDPLIRKFEPNSTTYWQIKTPAGPEPETMKNQF